MKKAKMAFWGIIVAFVALVAYQNWDFFMSTHALRINLIAVDYQTPQLQNIILFLIFFFAGLLISYFSNLFERYRSNKTIKGLKTSLEQNQKMLEALKNEIDSIKGIRPDSAGTAAESEAEPPSEPAAEAPSDPAVADVVVNKEKDPDAS